MLKIKLLGLVGAFAENKDIARDIRRQHLVPALKQGQKIVLDFSGIDSATQSFIHVLISDLIRVHGIDILDTVSFKACNETIKKIINIVINYMQESQG